MVLSKEEKREYKRKWYQEHKKEINLKKREQYKINPEKRKKDNKKWKKANPNKVRKSYKKWYKENKFEYNLKRKNKYKTDSDKAKENSRRWRINNPDLVKKNDKKYHKKYKKDNIWLIEIFLFPYKCYICNMVYDPVCLDFHHINPKLKKFEISHKFRLASSQPLELIEEILKCIILCSNCHRLIENKKIKLKKIKNRLV